MNSNKLRVVLTLIITQTILCVPLYSYGAVIFQDDFESSPNSWTCANGSLPKWTLGMMTCGTSPGFGAEWKMGPGRNGGNAVYAWKHQSVPNGYRSESEKWPESYTGAVPGSAKTEVYHRWYMKIPPNFNKQAPDGFKFWRYHLGQGGSVDNFGEIYLNACGGSNYEFATGNLCIISGQPTGDIRLDLVPVSQFNDDQWHSHELRIKLNSGGASDGVIQYWLDGVLKSTASNLKFSSSPNIKVHSWGVGIGNVSAEPWYMTTWTPAAFDDVVVSTSYIGPSGTSPSPVGLAPPSNLRTQ